ncbi:MAG: hypothetical protein HMLKMBBP_01511 [Planctomycetes bacterium]|nr:hypothetical protein [Planctomycetota bacterium]
MSTLTDQVRTHLCKAQEAPTAAVIAQVIGASPLVVGNALDELRGLGHAREDGLHRWRITDKGRMANGSAASVSDPSPVQTPAAGTIAARLLEAISTDGHTATELMTITGLTKVQVTSNLSSLRGRGHAHTEGERGGEPIWRLGGVRTLKPVRNQKCTQCGKECSPNSGSLCRDCYLANAEAKRHAVTDRAVIPEAREGMKQIFGRELEESMGRVEIDRAVIAKVHDEQEAADVGKTTDFLRRVHTEAEEAVRAYLAALQQSDPQLKALIAVRDAAAVAVEAMGKHA